MIGVASGKGLRMRGIGTGRLLDLRVISRDGFWGARLTKEFWLTRVNSVVELLKVLKKFHLFQIFAFSWVKDMFNKGNL